MKKTARIPLMAWLAGAVLLVVAGFSKDPEIPEDLEKLLSRLEQAVADGDSLAVLEVLDADYKDHEYHKYLGGETLTLLNNFFCGQEVGTDQHHCVKFNDIQSFKRVGVKMEKDKVRVTYRVKTSKRTVDSEHEIKVKTVTVYGVVGSRGFTQLGGL